ncbi:endonuclease/exonuclease/phosphatase family protein [Lentzea kentuckyensis]|uniref:endonuclease/exonuclease/phosphatase family protein n=1 Tax=Lentzea kentuckyensis TaxID=360086 RepID=UPI000A376F57|nr:endonuclease/exonuclease/phosphatase family protein [Lentzea kentuckyensis]
MPGIDLARPPAGVTKELDALGAALDQTVPKKTSSNLLIGTWNVRAFDRMNPVWRSKTGDSPIRDAGNVLAIAEVVRRFDVVAVQELRRTAGAFLAMMEVLGDDWAFVVTDVTDGHAGNGERLAFVYDRSRVRPSGLACELVVAPEKATAGAMTDQFARTPYAVSFARGATRFTLVTLHVLYGEQAADRVPELTAIAQWLARWSASKDPWGENLIALGDFNIDRRGDPLYRAFVSTGLEPPAALNYTPRTIFEDPNAPADTRHFYDQIAWFTTGRAVLSLPFANAGTFDFTSDLIRADSQTQLSYRISDHFPLWCEFTV